MSKLMDKLKCNPLACLGIYLTILGIVSSVLATGYFNTDQKVTKIYEILIQRNYASLRNK